MMNTIDLSGLTVYKKHCALHMDSHVFNRLFCQKTSGLLLLKISQYALIYNLLYEVHNS